jgi:CubicO group peptidase (beta-lactamase class C family)
MTEKLSRREAIGLMGAAAAGMAELPMRTVWAQRAYGGSNGRERGEMGRIAGAFRRQFSVPATSIAISRNGQFAYDESKGMADREKSMQVTQSSLFRIASVSKPITSVTIFSLIEQGKLNLGDKVFGPSGVLENKYGKPPYKQYVTDITVDHLLTHTAGGVAERQHRSDVSA